MRSRQRPKAAAQLAAVAAVAAAAVSLPCRPRWLWTWPAPARGSCPACWPACTTRSCTQTRTRCVAAYHLVLDWHTSALWWVTARALEPCTGQRKLLWPCGPACSWALVHCDTTLLCASPTSRVTCVAHRPPAARQLRTSPGGWPWASSAVSAPAHRQQPGAAHSRLLLRQLRQAEAQGWVRRRGRQAELDDDPELLGRIHEGRGLAGGPPEPVQAQHAAGRRLHWQLHYTAVGEHAPSWPQARHFAVP